MEVLFAVVISTILMLIGIYYIPWIILLYPVLFIILGVRHGIHYSIIGLIFSTFSVGLMTDIISGVLIFFIFTPLSISLSYTIRKRRSSYEVLIISTLIFLVSILFLISIMKDMTGISIINELEEFFTQTINYQVEILKDTGLSNYEVLRMKDILENALDYILLIMPSIVMIFSLITAYLNYLISTLLLRKLGYGIVSVPKFSKFKLPNNALLGTGIMFLGVFIIKSLKLFYYETILINMTVLTSFVFFIQGLSVIDYKLIGKKLGPILRIFIILLFIILLPFGWIISFVGVLDVIMDFRKIRKSL